MHFRGINHVVLKVRDLTASDHFYREVLGLERVGERSGMLFYTAGGHHHDLALVELGAHAMSPPDDQTGLFHFCLDVPGEAALGELYRRCKSAGVPILGSVDHTIMRAFYVRDPDGHVVELGFDVPKDEWVNLPNPFLEDHAYLPPLKS
jgi:catechol 2,3-dioxygenase